MVLNWDEEKCRRSALRRVLPVRRSKQGTKPGIKGKGPRGKERGDMEQWVFPPVSLTEEEKLLSIKIFFRNLGVFLIFDLTNNCFKGCGFFHHAL